MKPGYRTTEFWIALLTSVGGLVIMLVQVFRPEQADQAVTFWGGLVDAAKLILPMLLPLVLGNQYVTARTAIKINSQDRGG